MDDKEDTSEKQLFKPRESKNLVPLGLTPTDIRGKNEWRCKDVQFIFLFKGGLPIFFPKFSFNFF